jgi:hypothetical protein
MALHISSMLKPSRLMFLITSALLIFPPIKKASMPPAFDYLGGICAGTYPVNEFRFLLHLIVFFSSPPKDARVISSRAQPEEGYYG